MRIGGLASGMDIDTLVSDLMKAERMPLDKLTQKKQILGWQRDDYRGMNKLLADLDKTIFDGVFRQATFLKKTVTSSDDSKVTATAVSASANTSATIEVSQLAAAASWKSTLPDGYSFTKEARTLSFKVTDPGTTTERDVTVSITADDDLEAVLNKINVSGLGVTAMRATINDGGTNKDTIIFTNNKTGVGSQIKASNTDTQDFMKDILHFSVTGDILDKDKDGSNAVVKVNGYEMQQTSNNFTINGINYTLKNKTDGQAVTISTTTDVDSIFNSIKSFVDQYNELIAKVNGKITEERYRSYQPLTDEQKKAMDEKQIELWEEKAKSGLLRNDSILSSALNKMRLDMYSRVGNDSDDVNNDYDQLAEIGIKTSSNYLDRGKLVMDEDKLKEAISKDPNAIYKLFTNDSTTFESKGIARRLRDTIKETIGKVEQRAGKATWTNQQFTIGKDLNNVDKQINSFEDRLKRIEDRYWRQFTAMEKAIQQSNSQSMYLMQQFGGGM